MLEVKGKAILDHIIGKLESIGAINEIIIVTNSKFIAKFRRWKKEARGKKKITLIDDLTKNNADRLGAIGDVNFVINKRKITEDVLVIGGDNLFNAGLEKFLEEAVQKKPAASIGVYRLKYLKDASRYGVVKLGRNKKVIQFEEKPKKPKSLLVAMCLYFIPQARLSLIGDYLKMRKKTDATGNYIDWLKERVDTFGFIFHGSWYDIGDFKYLTEARDNFSN